MISSLMICDAWANLEISSIASVLGIGIVFIVLALIIGAISFLNVMLNKIEEKKDKPVKVKEEVQVVEEEQEVIVTENVSEDEQRRIVAVITAALMVSAFDKPNVRFVVRKIKKV